jgi:hypothetical protein
MRFVGGGQLDEVIQQRPISIRQATETHRQSRAHCALRA